MKTLFLRSGLVLMATSLLCAGDQSFEQKVLTLQGDIAMSFILNQPITLNARTDANQICIKHKEAKTETCFAKEEFAQFLVEEYKKQAAKRDKAICDGILDIAKKDLPVATSDISLKNMRTNSPEIHIKAESANNNVSFNLDASSEASVSNYNLYLDKIIDLSGSIEKNESKNLYVSKFEMQNPKNNNKLSFEFNDINKESNLALKVFIAQIINASLAGQFDEKTEDGVTLSLNLKNPNN
jgi:hypothetical protein